MYKATSVTASITRNLEDDNEQETIEVDMYVWDGDMARASPEAWELDKFIAERLDDWLELFGRIELVGSSGD